MINRSFPTPDARKWGWGVYENREYVVYSPSKESYGACCLWSPLENVRIVEVVNEAHS